MRRTKSIRSWGLGCWKSVYETVLAFELERRGLKVRRQQSLGLVYETLIIEDAFRADLVVEAKVIVEIKSVEIAQPVHQPEQAEFAQISSDSLSGGSHDDLLIVGQRAF